MIDFKPGAYKVIRVDGSESLIEERPTIGKIRQIIGCDCLDSVTLDRTNEVIMMVDDTGMVDRKPVNETATRLARQAFGTQYPYSIHGDVVIVNDQDFA